MCATPHTWNRLTVIRPHLSGLLLSITLIVASQSAGADQAISRVSYNLTDYGSPLTTRVSFPPNWLPAAGNIDYRGQLDAHWLAVLPTNHTQVEISKANAVFLGAPGDFNLITAPDNCWGMFMNFGLIHLGQKSDLRITVAADASQGFSFAPAFGIYRGWDTSSTSSRHGTIFFGYDNPLGTQGLTYLGDAYSVNNETSVTQSFQNLEPGQYELFVTSRTNQSSDGAYTVKLETLPAGSSQPLDPGAMLCGTASNNAYEQPPAETELCRWGKAVTFRNLKHQRYTWTCYGPGTSASRAQCYTLGNNGKDNQPPLMVTPGNTKVLAGNKSTQTITGGSGKARVKVVKGFSTYGTRCRYSRSGDQLFIKTQGQAGECRFKVTKAGNKLFNEVESPSFTIQVEK